MTAKTREQIAAAFFGLVAPALVPSPSTPSTFTYVAGAALTPSQPFAFASRRIQMASSVPASNKPALFMTEHEEENVLDRNGVPVKTILNYAFWIFTLAPDQNIAPITLLNPLVDAVTALLKPNPLSGVNSLGGLVENAFISGNIDKYAGDLDGNGFALIPCKALLPCF